MAVANKVWEPAVYGLAELKDRDRISKGFVPSIPVDLGVMGVQLYKLLNLLNAKLLSLLRNSYSMGSLFVLVRISGLIPL